MTSECPCPHKGCHTHSHYRSTKTGPWECPLHEHDFVVTYDGPRVEFDGRKGRVAQYISRGEFIAAVVIDDDGYHHVIDVTELKEVR